MVSWTVMFGEVVGEVDGTGCPEHVELALVNAIAEPVEAHVDCQKLGCRRRVSDLSGIGAAC